MSSRLLVLCYHNVDSTWCFPSEPGTGQRGLERQLWALRRWANVLPLDDAVARLAEGRPLPPRAVAITFDDGYRDNLTTAVPMLERLGLPATFFLVPGLLSNETIPWWEAFSWAVRAATEPRVTWHGESWDLTDEAARRRANDQLQRRLKRLDRLARDSAVTELTEQLAPTGAAPTAQEMFLDWDESAELLRRGFDVGSHTCAHAILAEESAAEQERDLVDSRRLLAERLAIGVDLLAYPNGTTADYDEHTLAAARTAGYRAALTTTEGFNRPGTSQLELKRIVMYPERGVRELVANLRYAARPFA